MLKKQNVANCSVGCYEKNQVREGLEESVEFGNLELMDELKLFQAVVGKEARWM